MMEKIGVWLSALCSLLTICFVVWRGGALAKTVEDHDRRITLMEANGTSSMQRHEAEDRAIDAGLKERAARLEAIVETLPEIRLDIREIKTQLRTMGAK